MRVKTGKPLLTAMICVALSSGTAWAAVPELPASAFVQQQNTETGEYNAAALAQSSVANVVEEEKDKAQRGKNLDLSSGTSVPQMEQAPPADDFRHMPLRWQTVKTPKEIEAESKPQPLIITADDIEKQRKEQKQQEAAASLRQDRTQQPSLPQTVAEPQPRSQTKPAREQAAPAKPQPETAPQQVQQAPPAAVSAPAAQPAHAEAAVPQVRMGAYYQPDAARLNIQPRIEQPVETEVQPPQSSEENSYLHPIDQAAADRPPRQATGQMPASSMEPLAAPASRPQAQSVDMAKVDHSEPSVSHSRNQMDSSANLPGQIQIERPPEYDGISDEVVRHILAGEFAMSYQLSHDPTEPGIYKLARILKENDGLTHLQKIEYLIGFGRAINKSSLSEWQKNTFIKIIAEAFE